MNDNKRLRVVDDGGSSVSPSHDLVERLIRLAEEGPQIPANGADRVRNAIRPIWLAEVRVRGRRRRLLWAGSGLAAAACLIMVFTLVSRTEQTQPPLGIARLATVIGDLEILTPNGAPRRVDGQSLGQEVVAGSWLRTGSSARAGLLLEGGESLRLDSETRIRLVSDRAVDLSRGAVYVDSEGAGHLGIEVRTAFGVAREVGTQFEVRTDGDALTVRVREGTIVLARDGEEITIRHGSELAVTAGGLPSTRSLESYADEWAWVQELAPPFVVEGRSVVAFLDWVSRETGLWVSFADAEVESLAGTTVLHGTIEGLSPAAAPSVVLPGCGLIYHIREGVLTVERP
jgi:ferric-dicitrate binding protein FerR (iron transport regulator)